MHAVRAPNWNRVALSIPKMAVSFQELAVRPRHAHSQMTACLLHESHCSSHSKMTGDLLERRCGTG